MRQGCFFPIGHKRRTMGLITSISSHFSLAKGLRLKSVTVFGAPVARNLHHSNFELGQLYTTNQQMNSSTSWAYSLVHHLAEACGRNNNQGSSLRSTSNQSLTLAGKLHHRRQISPSHQTIYRHLKAASHSRIPMTLFRFISRMQLGLHKAFITPTAGLAKA